MKTVEKFVAHVDSSNILTIAGSELVANRC